MSKPKSDEMPLDINCTDLQLDEMTYDEDTSTIRADLDDKDDSIQIPIAQDNMMNLAALSLGKDASQASICSYGGLSIQSDWSRQSLDMQVDDACENGNQSLDQSFQPLELE